MKKIFKFLASLTLGFMVASCQSGLEEVINESAVQDELATTRAVNDTSDIDETLVRYTIGPAITGPSIITDTNPHTYSVNNLSDIARTVWSYNTSIFSARDTCLTDSTLTLTLNNASITADATISATFYDSNNNIVSQSRLDTGINGPHYNHCSIRVIRSSDGAEIYPNHTAYMEPNTYYYAYFYTSTGGSMDLDWSFYDEGMEILDSYAHTLYFKTGSYNYDCFLHVDGRMYGSSITKSLLGVVLY